MASGGTGRERLDLEGRVDADGTKLTGVAGSAVAGVSGDSATEGRTGDADGTFCLEV